MKQLLTTLTLLLLMLLPLAAQENEATITEPSAVLVPEPIALNPSKKSTTIALSAAAVSVVNSQEQQGFPIQLDFRRQTDNITYWGITAQYTSRKDAWVTDEEHYSDDNDQQIVTLLGTIGLRVPVVKEKLFFQFDIGAGVGYHIMKYGKVYPNQLIGYVHLSHWLAYRVSKTLTAKLSILPNITMSPYDAGAAYSHHPNVWGIYSFGIELNFNNN